MAKINFTDSFGFRTDNLSTFSDAIELIDKQDDVSRFGASDVGHSCLYWFDSDDDLKFSRSLSFFRRTPYGYHAAYSIKRGRAEDSFYLASGNDCFDVVELEMGGEPLPIPKCLFVSRDELAEAIRWFLQEGEMSNKLRWISDCDIPWDEIERLCNGPSRI